MKNHALSLYVVTVLFLSVIPAAAAVPYLVNYQGYLADSGGVPVDGQHNLTFKIYADSSQGAQALWTELHSNVDVDQGLFNVILGGTTTIPDSLLADEERWLGVTVDNDPEMTPKMRLTSVPWALRAALADSALAVAGGGGGGGGDITGVYPMDGLWSPDSGDAGDVHLFVLVQPGSGLMLDPMDGVQIEPEGVTEDKIAAGAVSTAKLDSASVIGTKLASEAVSTATLGTAAVTNEKLASFAVADTNLRVNAVTTDKLLNGAVNRDKLLDFAVTAAKLDTNAVTSGKIQDNTIQFDDIAQNGATEGQVMKYVGGQWAARNDSVGEGGAIDGVWGGTGLTGGGSSGSVTLAVDFGGNGADTTVARSDHDHDAQYLAGVLAGAGLTGGGMSDTVMLAVDFAGTGVDTTVARSDHDHDAVYINEGQDSSLTSVMIVDSTIMFVDIAQNGAADGQVMKWSSVATAWVAANDSVGSGGSGSGGWTDDGSVVRLEATGDSVGIGTMMPTEKLDVDGNIRASGKATFGPGHTNAGVNAFVAGEQNVATATHAAVGGGMFNRVLGDYSVVSGGGGPSAIDSNSAAGHYCVVGGGSGNIAGRISGAPEQDSFATVGGGFINAALGEGATVGGGGENLAGRRGIPGEGRFTTVGGGRNNSAVGNFSFVGGGGGEDEWEANRAYGGYSVVTGGTGNTAGDTLMGPSVHYCATIGGGSDNTAYSRGTTVAGGSENVAGQPFGGPPYDGEYATVGGGRGNWAQGMFSVVGGGGGETPPFSNRAYGHFSVVSGGSHNVAGDTLSPPEEQTYATVGGGYGNQVNGDYSTIGGGAENVVGMSGGGPDELGDYATIGGGRYNFAQGKYSVVGGGGTDSGPFANRAHTDYSVVGGGELNTAGEGSPESNTHATVSGGRENQARAQFSTVGGGQQNDASGTVSVICGGSDNNASAPATVIAGGTMNNASGAASVICGGAQNIASGDSSVVGGGSYNTASGIHSIVAGGSDNTASGIHSVVGGGTENAARDEYSAVPGGRRNEATGVCSFAAGNNAKARHDGSVVISAWRFNQPEDSVRSGTNDQMVLRAGRGFYLTDESEEAPNSPTGFIETSTGAWLSTSGQWQDNSDRAQKENFTDVDTGEILEKISRLSVTQWNYIVDDDGVTHIGPVAQDFHAAFGVGYSDKSISALDVGGISLAAVQELVKRNTEQSAQIEELKKQVSELRDLLGKLVAEKNTERSNGK